MNRAECKKYLKRAYRKLVAQNKSITTENIEREMQNVINEQAEEYIAYSKIAIYNMQNSANEVITLNDLLEEIKILPSIYTPIAAKERAKTL